MSKGKASCEEAFECFARAAGGGFTEAEFHIFETGWNAALGFASAAISDEIEHPANKDSPNYRMGCYGSRALVHQLVTKP